jgi:hypothetical protein
VEEAIALAQKRSYPYSLACALDQTVLLHGLRGEAQAAQARAEAVIALTWQQQGKRTEAYDQLAPVCGWLTEGIDARDLQEARALIEELS